MLLADEGLHSGEGTKRKDSKSSVEELVNNFLQIHESCSDKDAAPRRYMTFLKTYKRVYNEKKDGVVKRQQHLQVSQFSLNSLSFSPSSVLLSDIPYRNVTVHENWSRKKVRNMNYIVHQQCF